MRFVGRGPEQRPVRRAASAHEGPAPEGALPGVHQKAQRRLDRRLEEVAKVVGGGYCRLQVPL